MPRSFKLTALALAALAAPALASGVFSSHKDAGSSAHAAQLNKPVSPELMASLQKASKAGLGLATVPQVVDLKSIDGPRLAKGNKVGILYMGADFCPYCAGQRWALALTLLRFGKLDGLEYMLSSPDDAYPDTPTMSFQRATYSSDYIDFQAVETADRKGKKLMSPNKQQGDIYSKYDAPPYTQVFGAIPFIYVDGQYILSRPMVMPNELTGMDWSGVAKALNNPQSALFQSAMPQVNALTAAICRLDGGNPDDVCSAPGITAANGALLNLQPAGGS